jgi:FMN phosphatase YigB (HAD superfamily)
MTKFIYFDLGNVLVHFDPNLACRNIASVAGASEEAVFTALYGSGVELRYERGELDDESFAEAFRSELGHGIATSELLEQMAAMFTPHVAMESLIGELQSLVREGALGGLGILSNTCRAHWEWVQRQRWQVSSGWFGPAVLSYEVGRLKPEPEIYEAAREAAGVDAAEIFFTDDRLENIHAAQQSGWRAEVFQGVDHLRGALRDWGVPVAAG